MRERLLDALGASRAGHTEIRFRRVWTTTVLIRRRRLDTATGVRAAGGVIRCCSPGSGWGIVGFSEGDRLPALVTRAHELALAVSTGPSAALAPVAVRQFESAQPPPDDPRDVPLDAKRRLVETLAAELEGTDRRIVDARVLYSDTVTETWLATSEGTWVHELRPEVTIALLAVAEEDGTVERALGSIGVRGGWRAAAGRETLARDVAARAVERLHATPVRPGRYTVVLNPAAAGALAHRVVGHLARPATPGADPDVLSTGTRIGPDLLTIGDDPTAEGLRPSSPLDDEGTPARRTVLVQNGVVVGHLQSRLTAARTGEGPTGHARAAGLRSAPVPRAANTYLAQGQGSRDDLLRPVSNGIYLADVLACEASGGLLTLRAAGARLIRNGRLAEPVKGVEITGGALALLGRVEAVGGDFTWDPSAARCRDGATGELPITTGAPHVRLVDVPLGAGIS